MIKCNKWMFQKVKCSAYMKKINDGRYIQKVLDYDSQPPSPVYLYMDGEGGEKEVDEYCANHEFSKTYYKRTEKEFVGIVVGMKMVVVSSWLYVDTQFDINGHDIGEYIGKDTKDSVKCALVYYGCNRSRLVPMDCMEVIPEEKYVKVEGYVHTGRQLYVKEVAASEEL